MRAVNRVSFINLFLFFGILDYFIEIKMKAHLTLPYIFINYTYYYIIHIH